MSRLTIRLMILGAALLALVAGITFLARPWDDSSSGRTEAYARSLVERWLKARLLDEDSTPRCETLQYDSGGWYLRCYELIEGDFPAVTVTVRLPDNVKTPVVVNCGPVDACEQRGFIPEGP